MTEQIYLKSYISDIKQNLYGISLSDNFRCPKGFLKHVGEEHTVQAVCLNARQRLENVQLENSSNSEQSKSKLDIQNPPPINR